MNTYNFSKCAGLFIGHSWSALPGWLAEFFTVQMISPMGVLKKFNMVLFTEANYRNYYGFYAEQSGDINTGQVMAQCLMPDVLMCVDMMLTGPRPFTRARGARPGEHSKYLDNTTHHTSNSQINNGRKSHPEYSVSHNTCSPLTVLPHPDKSSTDFQYSEKLGICM